MGTLSRETTTIFIYKSFLRGGSALKGKNLLQLEQILSFKSRPLLERLMSTREGNRKLQKVSGKNKVLYPVLHLICSSDIYSFSFHCRMVNEKISTIFSGLNFIR